MFLEEIMIIPIKITTEYSLLKSLIKIPNLIQFLCAHQIPACGICDDELFGWMEFYLKCEANHIKPLLGMEVTIDDHIYYLYAKNYQGYLKILKINSLKYQRNILVTDVIDDNILVIIPYAYIDDYKLFTISSNIYLAYSTEEEKQVVLKITNHILWLKNIHALAKKDLNYLEYLSKMDDNASIIYECYEDNNNSDDQKRVNDFVNQIDIQIPFKQRYIPKYSEDSENYLTKLAKVGLAKRLNGNVPEIYQKRLNEELKIIKQMGFIDYFLIVYDYVLYAKKNQIAVGPGRGSAGSSLVCFAIGITDIDPLKYNLLFARFLNPYRQNMPDIDMDFEDARRMEVIEYIRKKYGHDKTAVGITFSSLKTKMVLREVGKILKIDNELLAKFLKNIDGNLNLQDNLKKDIIKKFLSINKELVKLYDIALHLENLKCHISTHAAGVVICNQSLDNIIPIYNGDDMTKTGYAMEYLEKLGLLKMDVLGLRNLTFIKDVIKRIPNFDLKQIPLNDPLVYDLFKTTQTDNIFQFESNYAKTNLLKLQVASFNELCIAMALVRPGPSNQIDEYINNKTNKNYSLPPLLEPILKDTHGIIIYQEQVMQIFQVIGDFNAYEADNIRYAMSKKKEEVIEQAEKKFIASALKKGFENSFIQDLFNKLRKFSEFGFNKAHSVAYSLIAYQIAYLKVHYPLEFNLTLLNNEKDDENKQRIIREIKKYNYRILKPSINEATENFQIRNNYLLLPFTMIKGLNTPFIQKLVQIRQNGFKDIYDFMLKMQDNMNESIFELLVYSEALKGFNYNMRTLILNKELLFNYAFLNDEKGEKPLLIRYDEYTLEELRMIEIKTYGFYVTNHPCDKIKGVIKVKDTKTYLFKTIRMAILIEKINIIKTKKGEKMAFIYGSDETGNIDLTIFPNILKNLTDLKVNDIIFFTGKSTKHFDKYQIIVNNVIRKC